MFELKLFTLGTLLPDFYKEVKTKRFIGILLRLIILSLILSILGVLILFAIVKSKGLPFIDKAREDFAKEISKWNYSYFKLKEGILLTDLKPMPYEFSDKEGLVLIDIKTESARLESEYARDNRTIVLILSDRITYKKSGDIDYRTVYYSSLENKNFIVSKKQIDAFLSVDAQTYYNAIKDEDGFKSLVFISAFVISIVLFFYYYLRTIVNGLIVSLLVYIFKSKERYLEVLKMSLAGSVLSLFISFSSIFGIFKVPSVLSILIPTLVVYLYYKNYGRKEKIEAKNEE